jgi:hypothetical protein
MQPSKSLPAERRPHLFRRDPVVVGAGVLAVAAAHEGALLHARDIVRVGAREKATRALFLVQLDQHAGGDHFAAQAVVFFLRAVAPVDAVGLGQAGDLVDPVLERGVSNGIFAGRGNLRGRGGTIHQAPLGYF